MEKLCDRIGIIHKGRLVESGTLEELKIKHGNNDLEELFVRLVGVRNEAETCDDSTAERSEGSAPRQKDDNIKYIASDDTDTCYQHRDGWRHPEIRKGYE